MTNISNLVLKIMKSSIPDDVDNDFLMQIQSVILPKQEDIMIESSPDLSSLSSSSSATSLSTDSTETTSNNPFIFINNETTGDGLYHQSITLTARMWPPVEADPPTTIWGLPPIVWGIIIGCLIIALLILTALFICCYILPRKHKILSPIKNTNSSVAHRTSIIAKTWGDSGHIIMPISIGLVPPQYSAPPPPPPPLPSLPSHSAISHNNSNNNNNNSNNGNHHHYYTTLEYFSSSSSGGGSVAKCGSGGIVPTYERCNSGGVPASPACDSKHGNIPETHKSMWAVNPLRGGSSSVLNEQEIIYKSRSLPSWGKAKPRPISTTDDLEELYAKVNFSKKRRNRMRNDEAAIIALCRSRSQNLASGLPLEREGVVIYDERTAL